MIEQIDTRHGTANQATYSNGNCLPYTGVPFGMNYFAVQTNDQQGSWWFHPEDRVFQGIRLTHQPSPWMGDFSSFLLTPVSGNFQIGDVFASQSSYRPEESIFQPHYLSIRSLRYQIKTELTASTYGAKLVITYQQEKPALYFRSKGPFELSVAADKKSINGWISNYSGCEDRTLKMYFKLSFSQPIVVAHTPTVGLETTISDSNLNMYLQFPSDSNKLEIALATSFISSEQAALNLHREETHSFAMTKEYAKATWESYLNRISITDNDQKKVQLFYQMMYRCFLFPQKWYELDEEERPIHYDTRAKTTKPGFYYTNNGFWDTHKTLFPLFSLIATKEYTEMLAGFLNAYHHTGYLPKWLSPDERGLMPGTLIDAVIADAAVKEIAPELMPEFLQAMIHSATTQSSDKNYGRTGVLDYLQYGYVPSDIHESVNQTLDYAYSDFCISQVAQKLHETKIQEVYLQQSKNYRHLFQPSSSLMVAKDRNGAFIQDFQATRWGRDYAEGSAYQSSYAVFHDFQGLITLHGGKDNFYKKITKLCNTPPVFDVGGYGFEIHEMSEMAAIDFGQIAISNQPSFHLPYLFHFAARPDITQHLLKEIMTNTFTNGFRGYPGDEDNGSMSAWYIFNLLGFYPLTPGSGEYAIGIPLVDKVEITLANGKMLTIQTNNNHQQNHYVEEIRRNQQVHSALFFTHKQLMDGGHIEFTRCLVPPIRNYPEADLPFSL